MKTIMYDSGLTVFNSQAEALAKFNSGDSGGLKKFPWIPILGLGVGVVIIIAGYLIIAKKKPKEDTKIKG